MRYLCSCLLFCIVCNSIFAQSTPGTIPSLSVDTGSGRSALIIHKLDIQVSVTGNIANTVYDITFYNPFDRILEGSFEFPLAEGQSVFRYGLEVNGQLRNGVVVEKQQARVAYENTIRQNIDPGIIEKTKGNSYRTRIYPIPAKGYKRVVIGVEEALRYIPDALQYLLPLYSSEQVASFSIKAVVYNSERPTISERTPASFAFNETGNDWNALFTQQQTILNSEIKFTVPFTRESPLLSFTGEHKGNTYFYFALPMQYEYVEKKLPSSVTILWDVSASGEKRKLEKETQLLKDYLAELKTATIRFIPFNNKTGKTERFTVRDGKADALFNRIAKLDYDGGTQLGAIDLRKDSSEQVLLFTDGIATFGKKEMITGKAPVTAISSAANAEHAHLNRIAEQTNGIYLNLDNINAEEALRSLTYAPVQFLGAAYKQDEITDVFHSSVNSRNGLSVAGILRSASAKITLKFGYGSTVISSTTYTITKEDDGIATVPRSWAALKTQKLEMQPKKNKEAITATGKEFSLVTSNTSLIVLDRIEDYVQYEITPPEELKVQYDSMVAIKRKRDAEEKAAPLEDALDEMRQLKRWYNMNFAKKAIQKDKQKPKAASAVADSVRVGVGSYALSAPAPVVVMAESNVSNGFVANYSTNATADTSTYNVGTVQLMPANATVDEVVVTVPYGATRRTAFTGSEANIAVNQVRTQRNSPVVRAIAGTAPGVQVTNGGGAPGSGNNMQVRGAPSSSGNNAPLIVVDGVFYNGVLSSIPQGDIASLTTLDDAAATSLYGSRAANGVIVVTTRNGRSRSEERVDTSSWALWGIAPNLSAGDSTYIDPAFAENIEAAEFEVKATYMKDMQKALPANYYTTYLKLKKDNRALPSFYVDVASFLHKKGYKTLALQVLSNIAELQLEDAELLRILGHKLQQWNEITLALETFKDVLEINEEHPQSWRDLALVNAEAGNLQEAADQLYHILSHQMDERFDRMTGVVINEFNALISASKQKINTAAYDTALIYAMPVDVRIVISWTSDNSDIDLWVADPLNERCGYTNKLTKGGGRLSGDITTGFGPEEYMMKKAVNGSYTAEINYFGDTRQTIAGPVTVKAELYTHYGTPQQKKQVINVRLESKKETLKLGTLVFNGVRN